MGSKITTVGNRAGKPLAVFTAAGQDTGVMLGVNIVIGKPGISDLPMGYRNVTFQLLVGDMTAGEITVYGTFDRDTSIDMAENWEPLVAPSTEAAFQWSNPLTAQVGQRTLKTDAAYIAYRAVASDDYVGTTATLIVMAAP